MPSEASIVSDVARDPFAPRPSNADAIDPAPQMPLDVSADQSSVWERSPSDLQPANDDVFTFLQPLAPRPPSGMPAAPANPGGSPKPGSGSSGAASGSSSSGERRPIGQQPEDSSQIFLRQSTILLKPGQAQFDIGFTYDWNDTQALSFPGGIPTLQRARDRTFLVPMSLRYGWSECLESYLRLPVGMAVFERSDPSLDLETIQAGIADISAGFKYLWHKAEGETPDVIFTAGFTAPTGVSKWSSTGDVAALGGGFWAVNVGLNVVKQYDPIVAYANIGFEHAFSESFQGVNVRPGESLSYGFGFGFAMNEHMTLSMEYAGRYQTDLHVGGRRLVDSSQEPGAIRLAVVRTINSKTFVEPYVRFGVTPDAVDREFGFYVTRTLE